MIRRGPYQRNRLSLSDLPIGWDNREIDETFSTLSPLETRRTLFFFFCEEGGEIAERYFLYEFYGGRLYRFLGNFRLEMGWIRLAVTFICLKEAKKRSSFVFV